MVPPMGKRPTQQEELFSPLPKPGQGHAQQQLLFKPTQGQAQQPPKLCQPGQVMQSQQQSKGPPIPSQPSIPASAATSVRGGSKSAGGTRNRPHSGMHVLQAPEQQPAETAWEADLGLFMHVKRVSRNHEYQDAHSHATVKHRKAGAYKGTQPVIHSHRSTGLQ